MKHFRRLVLKTRRAAQDAQHAVGTRFRPPSRQLTLESVQRRLEIVLAATYGRAVPILAIREERSSSALRRAAKAVKDVASPPEPPLPTTDGVAVLLPPVLGEELEPAAAIAQYRLLAMEQAERIARGTHALMPLHDPIARDLYLLREAAEVDRSLARANAGLASALRDARAQALADRPAFDRLAPAEQEVERMMRDALTAPLTSESQQGTNPADSLQWAAERAAQLRGLPGGYRGVPAVGLWGVAHAAAASLPSDVDPASLRRHDAGAMALPIGNSTSGLDAPPDSGRVGVSDAPKQEETPPAEGASTAGRADANAAHDVHVPMPGDVEQTEELPAGISYPEWDHGSGRYLPHGVTVRTSIAREGDERWANDVLSTRAALVRRVQQQFERLRARRTRLHQQRRGDDIDIVACVRAVAERRAGLTPTDRLYTDVRPARRGLAITLLVDVSGSTDTQVTHELQVIDIEKISLLLATAAFDALGDAYSVMTFTGRSAADVRVTTVKAFAERAGAAVRRRIAALQPEGGTRLGAAVRHATAELLRQPAGHRLLLMLSDGRPNDVGYLDDYAVEDSRQAILDARASGIFPFCLTIDRDGAEYLTHVFGSNGHIVIRNPEQLPSALLRAVRQLLRFA